MRQSNRLIISTVARFIGTSLNLGLGLLTARWLLGGLGFEDFGLLSAVGASVLISTSIAGALSRSAGRHMAFEMGKGDDEALRRVFSTTVLIFLAMTAASLLLGLAVMPLVFHFLTVPEGREAAARWAYECSLVQWCTLMATTPMRAALHASQANILLSCMEVGGRISVLAATGLMMYLPGDRLMTYSLIIALLTIFSSVSPIVGWWRLCPACRVHLNLFERGEVWRIGHFAGWSMLQNIAETACGQGSVVILNTTFDAVINGAYSLAQRAANCQSMFAGVIMNPIAPAVTGYHARNAHEQVRALVTASSKYLVVLNLLMWVPCMLESEQILKLWLDNYPPLTPNFLRLMLSTSLVASFSAGYSMALEARGHVGKLVLFWNLPLVVAILVTSGVYRCVSVGPWFLPVMALATTGIISLLIYPIFVGPSLGIAFTRWAKEVAMPCISVMLIGMSVPVAIWLSLSEGWLRLVAVTAGSSLAILAAMWFLAMDKWEKSHFVRVSVEGIARLRSAHSFIPTGLLMSMSATPLSPVEPYPALDTKVTEPDTDSQDGPSETSVSEIGQPLGTAAGLQVKKGFGSSSK